VPPYLSSPVNVNAYRPDEGCELVRSAFGALVTRERRVGRSSCCGSSACGHWLNGVWSLAGRAEEKRCPLNSELLRSIHGSVAVLHTGRVE